MTFNLKTHFKKYNSYLSSLLLSFACIFNVSANTLTDVIKEQERLLGGRIGVSVYDVSANKVWDHNGDSRFPLMSTFKVLACAKLLSDVDKGLQLLNSSTVISADSLIEWSPVTEKLIGEKITLKQACSAAMTMSDNTASNILLDAINGPKELTAFMRSIGDNVTRLDRIEPELNEALDGDKRDTTTPNAMVKSLHTLLFGKVLSQDAKTQLKQWMIDNKITGNLLRSVLPDTWLIADRSGSGGFGSRAITAVVWSDTRSPLIISIYLTQTKATLSERNKTIANIGKEIFALYNN
ncbi:class A beta-lactamase [Pseudocolwellia sp. HL-MZ19]|uniref:class A beta-lactamase n=1 Tax=unclassified Pseudocolwellia TaxID=2848178 RepID=UPI003CE7DD94